MGQGIDIPCPGIIVVSVDKAASSSHMDEENAVNKMKERWKGRAISTVCVCVTPLPRTATVPLRSASLIPPLPPPPRYPTVPRGCTDTGRPSHHQNQYSEAPSTHPRPPRRALALSRHPSSACQEGKETARTSPVEVATAWILSQPAQTVEAAVLVRWGWNRKICPESSW
jgi:hypothetical protein